MTGLRTDDLVAPLAADPHPGSGPTGRLARLLPAAVVLALAMLWVGLGLRADLGPSLAVPLTAMKPVLPALLAVLAAWAALRRSGPERDAGAVGWLIAALVAGAAVVWWQDLAATSADARGRRLVGDTLLPCLLAIPALSALPTAAILVALRRGASTAPGRSGALAGLAGGGLGAAIYALHCTEDAPLFFVTWYGTGILVVTLVAALAGRRWLRW